jgi:integrase
MEGNDFHPLSIIGSPRSAFMASISRDPNGRRRIQFVAADGKRKSIRLGKVSQRIAEEIRVKVEALNAAVITGCPVDHETAQWVARLGEDLARKLSAVGLIPRRSAAKLGAFLEAYIVQRSDVKPNTRRNLEAAVSRLIEYFGDDKNLCEITPGDADAWFLWLRQKYASGTIGRTVKRAKQFFRAAVRARLISENPSADVKPPSQVNEARKHFVTQEVIYQVIGACPDAEWRLIVALSRFGGLRCPSEHLTMGWADVDWEKNRFKVHSPKTEHLENGGDRWVPIFPELRPYLEEAFELAKAGSTYVINCYRDTNANLRTQLLRIIKRAGVKPWPKLFQNLRASRETELAREYPIHVVCTWIGNTEMIAAKHYLQVTDDYFEEAARGGAKSGAETVQNPASQPAAPARTAFPEMTEARPEPGFPLVGAASCDSVQDAKIPPRGLEPLS